MNLKKVSLGTVPQEELSLWENACGEHSKQQPLLANTATTWPHTFKTVSCAEPASDLEHCDSSPPPLRLSPWVPTNTLSWVRDYVCGEATKI